MTAYYNENNPEAAAWLRELIKAGLIAPGHVDDRSIEDVQPADLDGFTQCHFFAGIGIWSWSLHCAGWPDDRPVWTGSCPCQPFSQAGKGEAFDDPRHLWPTWFRLIRERRPDSILGEQVANGHGLSWLDVVFLGLEEEGYACGAVDSCAAGFGAPHLRQRLYWVADSQGGGAGAGFRHHGPGGKRGSFTPDGGDVLRLADAAGARHKRDGLQPLQRVRPGEESFAGVAGLLPARGLEDSSGHGRGARGRDHGEDDGGQPDAAGQDCGLGHAQGRGCGERRDALEPRQGGHADGANTPNRPVTLNGYWRDADWLLCRDGVWRPVEPGTFPLAHGVACRMGLLRGFGNGIVAPQAEAFVRAYMETIGLQTGEVR